MSSIFPRTYGCSTGDEALILWIPEGASQASHRCLSSAPGNFVSATLHGPVEVKEVVDELSS